VLSNPTNPFCVIAVERARVAAQALHLDLEVVEAAEERGLDHAFLKLSRCRRGDRITAAIAMKALHDFATPGGLIYSYFIRGGNMEHGLLHYSDRFVRLWMHANAYEEIWRSDAPNGACTWIVVRKTTDLAFKAIVDVQEGEGLPVLRVIS
jgi:hypothetical protein